MLSAWLDDTSYDVAISFYCRLNICLNETLSWWLTFYVCKFWKIATKVARLLGVRTQENASYVSKPWFIMGNRPFRLYPPFTCRLQHQREKTLLFLPPLHTGKRKKNEETLFLASPRLICIPVFLEKEAHDWRMKRGGGGVVSGNLRARHQPHKTAAITADTLSPFSLEEGKRMDSQDRCGRQVSEVTRLLTFSFKQQQWPSCNKLMGVLRAPWIQCRRVG